MLNFRVSTGLLIFLAFSSFTYAQEAEQAGTVADEPPSDTTEAVSNLPDQITIESSLGNVVLPHDVHVKDKKLKCVECHHQIHAEELDTPHPDYLKPAGINCDVCHGTNSETRNKYYKCYNCHHSDSDDISDETLSSKVVIHKSCWKCHESGTGVEASIGCVDCHMKEEK